MSDVMPNYPLRVLELELNLSQLRLSKQSAEYRIAQLQDEIDRLSDNVEATGKAITEKEAEVTTAKENAQRPKGDGT